MGFKNKLKSLFSVDEEYEYEYVDGSDESDKDEGSTHLEHDKKNVVSLTSLKQPTAKVVLCEPRTYNEAQEIADNIVNRRSVVINLERLDHQQAKRIIDFLSGTVYALNGDIQKLGAQTFLCIPDNVEISGAISESHMNEDDFERGW